jgi:hypothetical protein
VAGLCFAVYNANARMIPSNDSRPARYLPFAVLRDHRLTLEGFAAEVQAHAPAQYALTDLEGRLVSNYPVVTPLLAVPLYLPAFLYLQATGWNAAELGFLAALMEKLAASTIAALAMGGLYLLLRRRLDARRAALLALACAFAGSTWTISGQTLWQHGAAQLVLVAGMLAVSSAPSAWRLGTAAGLAALLCGVRPADLPLAAVVALWAWRRARRPAERIAVVAGLLGTAGVLSLLNVASVGHPLGGYVLHPRLDDPRVYFREPLLVGLAGELLSPGKGLIVFSPWLLAVLARARRDVRAAVPPDERGFDLWLAVGIAVQLLLFAKGDWRAGDCYGPRYATDLLPALAWLLAPVLPRLAGAGRWLFLLAVGWGVAVQAIGAFRYPSAGSDRVLYASPTAPWRPGNAQFLLELRGTFDEGGR